MATYDWIVVGNGLAGAALSYELAKTGAIVLLLDSEAQPPNATRYSYGGIAYWSGTDDLTRTLCQEGIALHRQLAAELEADTQFREVDLLLTIPADRDPAAVAAEYDRFEILPKRLDRQTASELEPLLNPDAISGALLLPHGHVSPEATVQAYNQAFQRLGGKLEFGTVTEILRQSDRVQGVATDRQSYAADRVAICAGGLSRSLLKQAGIATRLYFTQAEIVETPPINLRLQALVMPAEIQRFSMEAKAGLSEFDELWDQPGQEVVPAVLDAGVVQLQDGSLRIGQTSRTCTDPHQRLDAAQAEAELRQAIGQVLPSLQTVPGQWRGCTVAFSGDRLPLVGELSLSGLYAFAGFSNPFAILPPIARRWAQHLANPTASPSDAVLAQLAPDRFLS